MRLRDFFDENKQLNAMSRILLVLTGLDMSIILFCYVTLYLNINAYSNNEEFAPVLTGVIILFLLLYVIKFREIVKIKKRIDEKDKFLETQINREVLRNEKIKAVEMYQKLKDLHGSGNYDDIVKYSDNNLKKTDYEIIDATDSLCMNAIISTYIRKTNSFNMKFEYECISNVDQYNDSGGLDSKIINTVLGNLLDNAIEANSATENLEATVKLKVLVEGNQIVYSVSNNGPEIVDISKIFKSRFSTKGKGRGMGLVAVTRLLEEYNGNIDVSSNKIWTNFQVRFNHYV